MEGQVKNTPEFNNMKGQLAENNGKEFKKQKWVFTAFPNCYYISKLLLHLFFVLAFISKLMFLVEPVTCFCNK